MNTGIIGDTKSLVASTGGFPTGVGLRGGEDSVQRDSFLVHQRRVVRRGDT